MSTSKAIDLTPRHRAGERAGPARGLAALGRRLVLQKLAALPRGHLTLLEDGQRQVFGPGGAVPRATVTIRHPRAFGAIAFGGTIGAAEAHADGLWDASDLPATVRLALGLGDGAAGPEPGWRGWARSSTACGTGPCGTPAAGRAATWPPTTTWATTSSRCSSTRP